MRFPESTDGSFGRRHFGEAPLADARRVTRLVRVADQVLVRPTGTLPQKVPDPYPLDALYRLLAAPDVTHPAVSSRRPSAEKRTAYTATRCVSGGHAGSPVVASHTRTCPAPPAVTITCPSGDQSRVRIDPSGSYNPRP